MKKLAILGLGHIGRYVFDELTRTAYRNQVEVSGYDLSLGHDLSNREFLDSVVSKCDGVLASTPFFLNKSIAESCAIHNVDYFDLTESVEVTNYVRSLNSNSRFVTQCGLAPGMVSIIANSMAQKFDVVNDIEIRVGALPQNSSNHLQYYRTWNTEGLINEYIHSCPALRAGELVQLQPLQDLEQVVMNGVLLEAANTSGGIGSLAESWNGLAKNVNYKTLRYPGHWSHIKFLHDDLGLKNNFDTYVKLFNENVPVCTEDCIYILITVRGQIDGVYTARQYSKVIMSTKQHTAIQISTGSGVLCVIDAWSAGVLNHMHGWIAQEHIPDQGIFSSQYFQPYMVS